MSHSISEIQQLTSPNPFCLVTSCGQDGKTNIMALSWWTHVSNKPATIVICVGQRAYTGTLINQTHEFGLCVVGQELKSAAFNCGTCSGRDLDKSKTFGVELIPAETIAPKIIKTHRVALECKVIQSLPIHDHVMHIAEVSHIHINRDTNQLYALEGYRKLGSVKSTD